MNTHEWFYMSFSLTGNTFRIETGTVIGPHYFVLVEFDL